MLASHVLLFVCLQCGILIPEEVPSLTDPEPSGSGFSIWSSTPQQLVEVFPSPFSRPSMRVLNPGKITARQAVATLSASTHNPAALKFQLISLIKPTI